MAIERWEPRRDLMNFQHAIDRMFGEGPGQWLQGAQMVPIDMYQTDQDVIVKASIPGVDPQDVDITCTGDTCTIRGQMRAEHEAKEHNYHIQERRYGSFTRTFRLPTTVDLDKADASFENGVLTLQLPKAPHARSRRIPIQTARGQTQSH